MTVLSQVVDQLTEALDIQEGSKIAALIDGEKIAGWTRVYTYDDGTIEPVPDEPSYCTIKDLFAAYGFNKENV
jgi:hypothetical protein